MSGWASCVKVCPSNCSLPLFVGLVYLRCVCERCVMYGVWCMLYAVWCMMYDVWCMMLFQAAYACTPSLIDIMIIICLFNEMRWWSVTSYCIYVCMNVCVCMYVCVYAYTQTKTITSSTILSLPHWRWWQEHRHHHHNSDSEAEG